MKEGKEREPQMTQMAQIKPEQAAFHLRESATSAV
jgi:hypothetical protein